MNANAVRIEKCWAIFVRAMRIILASIKDFTEARRWYGVRSASWKSFVWVNFYFFDMLVWQWT